MVVKRSPGVNSFSPGDKLMDMVNEVKLLLRDFSQSGAAHFTFWFLPEVEVSSSAKRGTG